MHAVASCGQSERDDLKPAGAHQAAHLGLGTVKARGDLGVGQELDGRCVHCPAPSLRVTRPRSSVGPASRTFGSAGIRARMASITNSAAPFTV